MEDVTSPFFSLPLELREQIYGDVLASSTLGAYLLRTCREINREARKYLYQRPLKFENQRDFYAWLADTPFHLLDYVSELSLDLQDVDLRPVLTSKPSAQKDHPPSSCLMTWDLYQAELETLEMSLKRLTKIRTVTIGASSCQHSYLYRDFLTKFLEMLSLVYPSLCDLRLDGNFHHQELAFLKNLPELESFSFDGFSASSPKDATDILSTLDSLKSLSLFSKHARVMPNLGVHGGFTAKRQSITGDVMRTIDQLASFTVSESTTTTPALFFTPEVLTALQEHQKLKGLSIQLSYAPDDLTFESLETFLDKSSIERLELDWPNLHPVVLEKYRLLTTTTKALWVRATSEADAFKILWSIVECREAGDLRMLEKIVLIRSPEIKHYERDVDCDREMSGARAVELGLVDVSYSYHVQIHGKLRPLKADLVLEECTTQLITLSEVPGSQR
jgi:hypothetical protein